jgi:predicted Zn-dependent protease
MLSTVKYSDVIIQTAQSLHNLTNAERASITQTQLHIVKAREGETLKDLSSRTGNVLDLEYTALINDIEKESTLSGEQLIKIGVVRPY